jgi:gluconate 5-dehydrogenase
MLADLFDVTGKVILITGSSQGIGLSLARGFGQAGARVVLNGRAERKLRNAVETLKREGVECHGFAFDVCKEETIQNAVVAIETTLGEIDVLVNNAGIQIRAPLEQFPAEDWRRILEVNLTGAFLTSKSVVQGMIRRRAGKIINICSIQSELARPTIAPYTAAKGGLKMLTKGMATDWGKHNIQVNALAPGYLKTEMTKPLYEDPQFNAWLEGRTPANRWGDPEELLGAAIFFASKASDYVNGQILYVDGGMLACV